jgi:peptide deformylase
MAKREIILLGNAILHKRCRSVNIGEIVKISSLIEDLRDTLVDFRERNGYGRGIAAPQIGSNLRILYIGADMDQAFINPKIVKQSRSLMSV